MFGRLSNLFARRDPSKNVAVERLRFVLMQDRANLSPEVLDDLREELLSVLSRYVEVDRQEMDVRIHRRGQAMALVASIPVRGLRRGARAPGS